VYATTAFEIDEMIGKTFANIEIDTSGENQKLIFIQKDVDSVINKYVFTHIQDCCESVYIAEIVGELDWLIDSPILAAEEVSSSSSDYQVNPLTKEVPNHVFEYEPDSMTWTFYKFKTAKGYVTIRWLGESNGYYSEGVDYYKETTPLI